MKRKTLAKIGVAVLWIGSLWGVSVVGVHLGTKQGWVDYHVTYGRYIQQAAVELMRETQSPDYGRSQLLATRLAALTMLRGDEEVFSALLNDEPGALEDFVEAHGFLMYEGSYTNRLTVRLSKDGTLSMAGVEFSDDQFRVIAGMVSEMDHRIRLHLVADREVDTIHVKRVVKLGSEAGLTDVNFGAFSGGENK